MIADAVQVWVIVNGCEGGLPSLAELEAGNELLARCFADFPQDPWGNAYVIVAGQERNTFVVQSNGPDGRPDTADDIRRVGRLQSR